MDKFTKMEFDPVGGLNNSAYQTTPVSEAEARANVQDVSDQLKNRLNGLVNELENAETTTSGAERIGSAAIENVTGITVREQILDLKTQIDGVSAGQVTPGSITDEKLAPDVKMGSLLSLTTTSKDCAVNAINELDAEIGDASALTTTATTLAGAINELKSASVEEGNIADGAVTENKIGPGAVTYTKIQNGAVTKEKIGADAIDGTKIANDAINSQHYVDGSIDKAHLSADCVDGNKIADNSINSEHYVDGSIDRVHLSADCVDGSKIANNSINSEHYVDGSIDAAHIASNAVTEAKIASGAVTTTKLGLCSSIKFGNNDTLAYNDTYNYLTFSHDGTSARIVPTIIVSTSDPSGTYPNGTIWVKY